MGGVYVDGVKLSTIYNSTATFIYDKPQASIHIQGGDIPQDYTETNTTGTREDIEFNNTKLSQSQIFAGGQVLVSLDSSNGNFVIRPTTIWINETDITYEAVVDTVQVTTKKTIKHSYSYPKASVYNHYDNITINYDHQTEDLGTEEDKVVTSSKSYSYPIYGNQAFAVNAYTMIDGSCISVPSSSFSMADTKIDQSGGYVSFSAQGRIATSQNCSGSIVFSIKVKPVGTYDTYAPYLNLYVVSNLIAKYT